MLYVIANTSCFQVRRLLSSGIWQRFHLQGEEFKYQIILMFKIYVYWYISPFRFLKTCRRFGGTRTFYLSADMVQHPRWFTYSNTAVRIWKVIIIIVLSRSCSSLSSASFGLALRHLCLTINFWPLFFPHPFCMALALVSKSSLFNWHYLSTLRILLISVHNFLYLTQCYRVVPQVCLVVHIISNIDFCLLFHVSFG